MRWLSYAAMLGLERQLARQEGEVSGLLVDFSTREIRNQVRATSGRPLDLTWTARSEGQWSPFEVTCHLAAVQHVIVEEIERMLDVDDPAIERHPETCGALMDSLLRDSADAVRGIYEQDRRRLLERLRPLDAYAWLRTARLSGGERCDVAYQVRFLLRHEAHHLYQVFLLMRAEHLRSE